MPVQFHSLDAVLSHGFDSLIDVRTPAEFAEDHIPGAINLPALSNEQRVQVGTTYKQISAFAGRKVGAGMVVRNVADHIDGPLMAQGGGWRPLLYCWRGGQRSGVFANLLSEIGWRADTLKGGYTAFRRLVKAQLYDQTLPYRLILLDGDTGTAKTEILPLLSERGVQTLDLEGMAHHRGSLLGARPGGQPTQKAFETALASALTRLDPTRPLVVEAESSKIGRINLPKALWAAMLNAPRIVIGAPPAARAGYLATAYRDVIDKPDQLARKLSPLRAVRGHAVVDQWIALSRAGDLVGLSAALIADHYDPAYAKSRQRDQRPTLAHITSETLDAGAQQRTADRIVAAVNAF